jgi:hypothetical protein
MALSRRGARTSTPRPAGCQERLARVDGGAVEPESVRVRSDDAPRHSTRRDRGQEPVVGPAPPARDLVSPAHRGHGALLPTPSEPPLLSHHGVAQPSLAGRRSGAVARRSARSHGDRRGHRAHDARPEKSGLGAVLACRLRQVQLRVYGLLVLAVSGPNERSTCTAPGRDRLGTPRRRGHRLCPFLAWAHDLDGTDSHPCRDEPWRVDHRGSGDRGRRPTRQRNPSRGRASDGGARPPSRGPRGDMVRRVARRADRYTRDRRARPLRDAAKPYDEGRIALGTGTLIVAVLTLASHRFQSWYLVAALPFFGLRCTAVWQRWWISVIPLAVGTEFIHVLPRTARFFCRYGRS